MWKLISLNPNQNLQICLVILALGCAHGMNLGGSVAQAICSTYFKFAETKEVQTPLKTQPPGLEKSTPCAWYQLFKEKSSGCSKAVVSRMSCEVADERQSPTFWEGQQKLLLKQAPSGYGPLIVGGEEAIKHEFPSIVHMIAGGYPTCGGILINSEWVLTAAHCKTLPDSSKYEIVAGDHNKKEAEPARQKRKVKLYKIHENYTKKPAIIYDIAAIKVYPPFELNDKVKVVTLPDPSLRVTGTLTAVGWGTLRSGGYASDILRKVNVPVVDDAACKKAYGNTKILENAVCAGDPEGGKDSCQGDSGGPLYKIDGDEQILAGIVSYGKDCGLKEYPGIYTETAYFIDWIKKHTCQE